MSIKEVMVAKSASVAQNEKSNNIDERMLIAHTNTSVTPVYDPWRNYIYSCNRAYIYIAFCCTYHIDFNKTNFAIDIPQYDQGLEMGLERGVVLCCIMFASDEKWLNKNDRHFSHKLRFSARLHWLQCIKQPQPASWRLYDGITPIE